MRDEKVIVDRLRLEELESKENTLDNHSDTVVFRKTYKYGEWTMPLLEEISYRVKDKALGELAGKLEKVTRDRNSYRNKLQLVEDRIKSFSSNEFKLFKRKSLIEDIKDILNPKE